MTLASASIGRLAAGAAHDINNPLAIINEKAGLIKDMFTLREDYVTDQKLMGLVNSVLSAVERSSTWGSAVTLAKGKVKSVYSAKCGISFAPEMFFWPIV